MRPLRCPKRGANRALGWPGGEVTTPTLAASPLRCPQEGGESRLGAARRRDK